MRTPAPRRLRSARLLFLLVLCTALAAPPRATTLRAAEETWPLPAWTTAEPAAVGLDKQQLIKARDYALTGGGSGYITRGGKLVLSWGDVKQRYDLKSTTKSFGATALGLAILDGKIALTDKAAAASSQVRRPAGQQRQDRLARQDHDPAPGHANRRLREAGRLREADLRAGTKWAYSDGGPNWLAECLTLAYRQDLDRLMFDRVFTPLGITRKDLAWRNNSYRAKQIDGIARREFGSGISANVDAMARFGLLYLRGGLWNGKRILPAEFVKQAGTTVPAVVGLPEVDPKRYGNASDHYGLLWWNNADGALKDVPRDAFWSWGLYDSLIVVIPSLDIVAARAGRSWKRNWAGHYDVLQPFLGPIAAAVKPQGKKNQLGRAGDRPPDAKRSRSESAAPYPPSPVITGIEWAPASSIVRQARGGDNWPLTWGDDDNLYTAYGDGRGFEPFVDAKLSMGLARIAGPPTPSTGESALAVVRDARRRRPRQEGQRPADGRRRVVSAGPQRRQLATGLVHRPRPYLDLERLEVHTEFRLPDVSELRTKLRRRARRLRLCLLARHRQRLQAGRSHGAGPCPGRSRPPTRGVRVLRGSERGGPTDVDADVAQRAAVFTHRGRCYRSGISYNAPLRRYLWAQTIPGGDTRFEGGFGVYDAPQPWGPWTTVFFTESWDVGPGETSSLPTKWISDDGRTIHLVFSGDDHFSVRRGQFQLTRQESK